MLMTDDGFNVLHKMAKTFIRYM